MKLYRYMSLDEFSKLTGGCTLESNRVWGKEYRSTSKGFCFLPEWAATSWEGRCANPLEAISFLSGIVRPACKNTGASYYLLVELECTCPGMLTEGTGVFAVPWAWGASFHDIMDVQEFSCQSYSRDTFIPLRYAILRDEVCDGRYETVWYDVNSVPDYVIASHEARELDDWYEEGDKIRIGRYKATVRPRVHH